MASHQILSTVSEGNDDQFKDKLLVRGLSARSVVGGDHWDRPKLQPITIDLVFFTSIEACDDSDLLAHSLSYSDLASKANEVAEAKEYESFQHLAVAICSSILNKFNGSKVTVSVQKPKGLLHAETSGIEISRTLDTSDNLEHLHDDRLFIGGLRLNTIIGVHAWEREAKQVVLIDLTLYPGLVFNNFELRKPFNYRTLVSTLSTMIEDSKFKTVEALATSIARISIVNCAFPKVTVRVAKPSALRFAAAAAAEITRDCNYFASDLLANQTDATIISGKSNLKHLAAIALGSNLLDRYRNIKNGLNALKKLGIQIIDTSFLYETAPKYVIDQPKFLNAVCMVKTTLSPIELLDALKSTEEELGRLPNFRNGPRLIDLDILFYDNVEMDTERLILPHPRIAEREFVLFPLCDVRPDWEHPKLHVTAKQLKFRLTYNNKESDEVVKVLPLSENLNWIWGSKTYIMGILNVTPDSFSDGGDFNTIDAALSRARKLIEDGADILDIGGASTRPDAEEVSETEEANRVVPVIKALREAGVTIPISVDTYRAKVAEEAILAGANLINDISGGVRDPNMLTVMAKLEVPVCLMHMRGDSKTMSKLTDYGPDQRQVMQVVQTELSQFVPAAIQAGVYRWSIILDPGIGFAKDTDQNLQLLRDLRLMGRAGKFPYLVGASRKRFIGQVLDIPDPKLRVGGTAATCTASIAGGTDILRIHDVKELKDVIKMSDALYRD